MVVFFNSDGRGYETKSVMVEIQNLDELDGCGDGKLYIDMEANGKWVSLEFFKNFISTKHS